jgi:hypothetical protein
MRQHRLRSVGGVDILWAFAYALKITSTGGYDSFNVPFVNVDDYGALTHRGERFLYDGHTSSNLNIGPPLTQLPPSTSWGHFHENMPEI